jgi:hypothetical protein
LLIISNTGCTQTKSYYVLTDIYRVSREPMMGMTMSYMEGLVKKNAMLVKTGSLIHVDFPEKFDFNIDTVKSITYSRIKKSDYSDGLEGSLVDSIYNISSSGDSLKISFFYGGSKKLDNRFQVAYVKITEADYYKYLKEDEAKAKAHKQAVDDFIAAYKFDSSWKIASHEPLKEQKLVDSIGTVSVRLPKNFFVDGAGSLYVNTIDRLKVGTLAHGNVHYKVVMDNDKESFGDANLFVVKAEMDDFDMKRYISGKSFTIVDQQADGFHAIQVSYNEEKKKAEISNYLSFRHFYKNGLHVVYLSDDSPGTGDSTDLAKRHYILMENLNVK